MGPERGRGIIKHSCCSWKERQAVGIHTVLAPALSLWQRAVLVEVLAWFVVTWAVTPVKERHFVSFDLKPPQLLRCKGKIHFSCVSPLLSHCYHTHNTSDIRCVGFFLHTKQLSVTPAQGSTIQFHLMLTCESHRPHRLKTQSHETASRFKCQFKD